MTAPIFILGGEMTDFSRNWAREELSIYDGMRQCVLSGLEKAALDASDINVVHIGNFVSELFAGQALLGGFMGHIHYDLAGTPTSRHESACASGSLAVLAAMADLEAGRYETACVLGVEIMRNVPGHIAANHLGTAAWAGPETDGRTYVWPSLFSDLAEEYNNRYGLNRNHLAAIAQKNFKNASCNPNAQSRNWTFTDESFKEDEDANPIIEGWMRRHDCGQVTDGAAVVFLATEKAARRYAKKRNISFETIPQIKGWGHTTAPMKLATKFEESKKDQSGYILPWTRKAIVDAYKRAGISGPEMLDGIETHDCFTITEYMAIEHFGITAPGEAWKVIEAGMLEKGGNLPVNASGGLIGLGHPVGATGVRMLFDAYRQTSGSAGDMQIEGAKTIATYNVGGSGTANISLIVGVG